jgi:Uma2 family endonuclease
MNPTLTAMPEVAPPLFDPDALYEVVDGQRKELPPMGAPEVNIACILVSFLNTFGRGNNLGRAESEMLFNLPPLTKQRRPDVAFVSYQRWPKAVPIPHGNAWDVVPELVVEVISPTDTLIEVMAKVREYFQVGVQLVWLVLPEERLVYVYTSRTQIHVLTEAEALDGGTVVPGFQMPVAQLFEELPSNQNGTGGGSPP